MIYLENNVFDEALERIRFVYDNHKDVIVSMSGGKDSTVLFHLAMIVAKEKNRLPLKVFWLDQEAEWQGTADYMHDIMYRDDVKPYWFQIPFDFTNSLSPDKNFLKVWDPKEKSKWIREQDPLSIKENPSKYNRFHDLGEFLPSYCTEYPNECAVLVGMRTSESFNRRTQILYGKARFKGVTWCKTPRDKTQTFWPIYDFNSDDIWTAIAKNHWAYNRVYDWMYQAGRPKKDMRVSAMIHETAWNALEFLQEFEPKTYDRFVQRIHGVSTFSHAFETDVVPKKLPFMFKDWKEYRDYLLFHITKPEYWELFMRRWEGQDGDFWYKTHVHEILINDIDGTHNGNKKSTYRLKQKGEQSYYHNKDKALFDAWKAESEKEQK